MGFPVIENDRALDILPIAAHYVGINEAVKVFGKAVETFRGEGHNSFGRFKTLARAKRPVKAVGIDAQCDSDKLLLAALDRAAVIAAVNKVEAPAAAIVLAGIAFGEQEAGIVAVGARAGGGGVYVESVLHLAHMVMCFADPAAVKGVEQVVASGNVNAHGHYLSDGNVLVGAVFDNSAAGDNIVFGERGVEKFQLNAGLIAHKDFESLRRLFAAAVIRRGQALHGNAAIYDLMGDIFEVGQEAAVGHLDFAGRIAIVSPAGTRPLKTHIIKAVVCIRIIIHYA